MKVAIIDPVGRKAGIDHYSLLLLQGMQEAGCDTSYYSNFEYSQSTPRYRQVFYNIGVSKISAITSNFIGFFTALRDARKNNIQWLILHVFRAGMFDLFTFSLAKLMGFRICAIIHDVESLDTFTLPVVRKSVILWLPDLKISHNQFSAGRIQHLAGKKETVAVSIIPHINFTDLFKKYNTTPELLSDLKERKDLMDSLHPQLSGILSQGIPVFLFFGQIKKAKGVDVLLEALSQSEEEYKVIIAGKPRDESWDRYDQIITALNIRKKVIPVIRHISDEERDFLFAISNAVVLPYHHIYQSGVLLMAMSFPMLVVASDLSPNADIIEDGKNGFLFPTGNSKKLAALLDSIVRNEVNRESLKENAFQTVSKGYGPLEAGSRLKSYIAVFNANKS